MTDHLPAVRRLRDENGWGSRRIGDVLGMGKDAALRLLRKLELEDLQKKAQLPAIITSQGLPALSFYDTARQALAQAKTLSEVKDIADKGAAVREFARRAKDQSLKIDAQEIIWRSERRLGEMLGEIKKDEGLNAGQIRRGANSEPRDDRPKLEDIGIDKKLSSRAQKLASISERAIEARIASHREEVLSGEGRFTVDLLKPQPSRTMNRVEAAGSLDPFFTPPWATRALCEKVLPHILGGDGQYFKWLGSVWEPACGEGHMCDVLTEYFDPQRSFASDIHDHTSERNIRDFLTVEAIPGEFDWIITNPPFRGDMAERFVLRALDLSRTGVAMFVALQFLETIGRYERIFKDRPPTLISFFAERVNCCKGRWDPDGSTDAAYVWLVWIKDRAPMAPFWIPPGCRASLSKPDDRARFAAWSTAKEAAE